MILISVGTEEKLFKKGGRVFERIKKYSKEREIGKYICFIFTKNKNALKIVEDNFEVWPIYGANKLLQILNLIKNIKTLKISKKESVTISSQDPFEIGFICYFLCKFLTTSVTEFLMQMHTDTSSVNFRKESVRNCFQYLLSLFVFRRADKIRVVSKRMQNYLVAKLNIAESKIYIQQIETDKSKFKLQESGKELEKKVDFLIMSRIEKVKNIENVILAIKEINKEIQKERAAASPPLSLKIVGSGSLKQVLQEKFSTQKDSQNSFITWADWTLDPVKEYYESRFFLLPSLYEGWGLTAVESVLCGTKVIMTDVGCAGEVVVDGQNGYIAEGFDVADLKKVIKNLL